MFKDITNPDSSQRRWLFLGIAVRWFRGRTQVYTCDLTMLKVAADAAAHC